MFRLTLKYVLPFIFLHATFVNAKEVNESLKEALTCGIDPLGNIRAIVASGSNFKKGYASTSYGDGIENTVVVTLEKPIEIYGAKTFAVIGSADNSLFFDFNGIVYAKFVGDYKKVVSALNLTETKDTEIKTGRFQRKLTIDSDGKPYETCPMKIGLTPLINNEFVLGCGWCNG